MGTKWRWTADDNYCVAIQTKTGVLQVKKMTALALDLHRSLYENYSAWLQTLPAGTVTQTLPEEFVSAFERRRKKSAKLLEADTPETVLAIQNLWNVKTTINHTASLNEQIAYTKEHIANLWGNLQKVSFEQYMAVPYHHFELMRKIEKSAKIFRRRSAEAAHVNADARPILMNDRFKGRLFAHTNKGKFQIAYDPRTKGIAATPVGASVLQPVGLYASLAELGVEMRDGKPDISVLYHRREIDL